MMVKSMEVICKNCKFKKIIPIISLSVRAGDTLSDRLRSGNAQGVGINRN